jgi:voltage-gated sodium channel
VKTEPGRSALPSMVSSRGFQRGVLALILVGAVIIGLETFPDLMARHGHLIKTLDWIVVSLFGVEALLKMGQHGRRWYRYFLDPWNVFDFSILVICLVPIGGHFAAVLRLLRVLRALRLVSAMPRLQVLVSALFKSIPSMGYVGLLLLLLFYIYAVTGVVLFQGNDPVHFGNLESALLSLFRVVTLEDWTDIMYIQMYGSDVYAIDNQALTPAEPQARPILGAAYFVSFVLLGTMVMLNLFIGVVIGSMQEAQTEARLTISPGPRQAIADELEEMSRKMDDLRKRLAAEAES